MSFSSSLFLLYFLPAFLLIYFMVGVRWRLNFLIISGLVFFFWGAPSFTLLLVASVIVNYHLAGVMYVATGKQRKTMLVFLLLLNLSVLFYFKYTGFFISQFNEMVAWFKIPPTTASEIILPVGISFIVFQKISYVIDVYRNTTKPAERMSDYALFILFFPKLLAGPIVRFKDFASAYTDRLISSPMEGRLSGFFRFSLGLAKKMMIANVLGVYVADIFSLEPHQLNTQLTWIGAFAYAFQIYFDFSAYSDMAIGLARMLGFNIVENFNNPYVSVGITEFWKRWHITLGTWLRDYLFLPVAYSLSRRLPADKYLGVKTDNWLYVSASLITMLVCGFWHGAGWTFIIWGLYHGVFMALERLFLMRWLKKSGRIPATAFTFIVVTIGWVLFRSQSVEEARSIIDLMFGFHFKAADFLIVPQLTIVLIAAAVFSFAAIYRPLEKLQMRLFVGINSITGLAALTVAAVFLFIVGLSQVVAIGFNPFIYFRF